MKLNTHTDITRKHLLVALLASAALGTAVTPAHADDASEVAALRKQIEALSKQVEKLEKRQVMTDADDAKAAVTTPKVTIDSKGLNISTPNKAFSLKIGALLQTDARFYVEGAATDTFLMRRVRLPVTGTFFSIFRFDITPEFATADTAGNNTQLFDAWVEGRFSSYFALKVGKFRAPVSLEGPDNRHFIESSFPNQLAPNRDIGVDASGSVGDGFFSYRFGLYNGAQNNVWSGTTNFDNHFSLGTRLTLAPFKTLENAASGLSFSLGVSYGSEKGVNTPAVKSAGQQNVTAAFATKGDHVRFAPAISWYYSAFSVVGEFIGDYYEHAGAAARNVTNYGWNVSGGWVITGEKSTPSGVSPAEPFSWSKGTWGAFELVARVGGLDVDENVHTAGSAGSAFSYGTGLNWWLNDNVLFRLGIERTHFGGVRRNTTNAAIKDDELFVFSRLQLKF